MATLSNILIDYLPEPVGVAGPIELTWAIECERRDAVQEAFRVLVLLDGALVYDSGDVAGSRSSHTIEGVAWESLRRYEVQVDVCVCGEQATGRATFATAMQSASEWVAEFVSAEPAEDASESYGTLVRGEFFVGKPVREAWLVCSAHGLYLPYLNGARVSADEMAPGWTSYNKRLLYQSYEVTGLLRPGANVLGAALGAGWYKGMMGYKHTRNLYGERTAFGAQLVVRYEDGSQELFATGEGWRGTCGPVLFSEIYGGEVYDARLEQDGWCEPGFDDFAWAPVGRVERDPRTLVAQKGCPVRVQERLTVRELIVTPEGDRVLDFGQNMSGRCEATVLGAHPGDVVELEFFEVLDAAGNVYTENLRGIHQVMRYVCRGGAEERYAPLFTYHGFRYAKVVSWPGELRAESLCALVLHSTMDETAEFSCSDARVNQLWRNIRWGMKSNFLDVPTDCPQRDERLGWTGDVAAFGPTSALLMNTDAFYRKWLGDVAADQDPSGAVTNVVPDILTGHMEGDWLLDQDVQGGASGWGDVAVMLPWALYCAYGDKAVLEQQMPSMQAWIAFMEAHSEGCLFAYGAQFGDWLALDAEPGSYKGATPDEYCCAAFFCHSMRLVARSLAALGRDDEATRYRAKADALCRDFVRRFVLPSGELAVQTQTAHVLALAFGLVPEELRAGLGQRLAEMVRANGGALDTGFLGTPQLMRALSENGALDVAYGLLMRSEYPSWLYQVERGATTIWEHWDGLRPDGSMWSPDMNSFNHYAYGSVGEWLFGVVAGLDVDESRIGRPLVVRPRIGGGLTCARASLRGLHGEASCAWEREGSEVTLRVRVPANVGARVVLEGASRVIEADGLAFAASEQGFVADCGSGEYVVRYLL